MATEVILKEPVKNLGAEADIVKVKPGFARNYLLPRGTATLATAVSKRQIEDLKKRRAEREAEELNAAQELAGKLAKLTLTFQMKGAGAGDKVFGSVTAQDIVNRLAEQGYEVEKKKLGLSQPIKTLGETTLNINLGHDIQTKLKIILDAPAGAEETAGKDKKKPVRRKKETSRGKNSGKDV